MLRNNTYIRDVDTLQMNMKPADQQRTSVDQSCSQTEKREVFDLSVFNNLK